MEIFNASAPPPREPDDPLKALLADDAEDRLLRLLGEIDDLVEEGRRRDTENGLDPGIEARLEQIAGAPGARFEFRSLHRRVSEGRLTWLQLWLQPELEDGGPALISALMRAEAAELGTLIAGLDEEAGDGRGRSRPD